MTGNPNTEEWRDYYGADTPPNLAGQLSLDRHDPDAMEDRAARLRAELDALDIAKTQARTETLDAIGLGARLVKRAEADLDRVVAEARGYGATWQQIADAAGLVKSAAWERWANRG